MATRLPLSALLSFLLVAFTIEFDNETEHRLPHRTTAGGRTPGAGPAPWLVSMAMWFNCMQHVDEQGISVRALTQAARTGTNLNGMKRWRYILLEPDPADPRPKPPRSAWLVRPAPAGHLVRQIWQPLFPEIENRWRERFGAAPIDELRQCLIRIADHSDRSLPDCLPVLGYGLFSSGKASKLAAVASSRAGKTPTADLPLPALLARVLLMMAIEFERESPVSLAISANYLRLLDEKPQPLRDLPILTGTSKELVSVGVGYLQRHGYAILEAAPAPDRGKLVRLKEKGLLAQDTFFRQTVAIEKSWRSRFGESLLDRFREGLQKLAADGTAERSPLFAGLDPYPNGWRAAVRKPATLPHYPLVSHRGGYPDGS